MTEFSEGLPAFDITTDWATLHGVPGASRAWAHHGVVTTAAGAVIGFHAGQLVTFAGDGTVVRVVPTPLVEGHGITIVGAAGEERLWVADPGFSFVCTDAPGDDNLAAMFGAGLDIASGLARVVQLSLDGTILAELTRPDVDSAYAPGPLGEFAPCGTAVDERRLGGSGDVWVADGYGRSLVHRYDEEGQHMATLSGEEGAGRFDCPHAVYIDRRDGKVPELYVADRTNHRVQVYDLDGTYRRSFGQDFLTSPSGFVQWGDVLIIAELNARLAAVDTDDRLRGYIGHDEGTQQRPGWPNALSPEGRATAPPLHGPGFNSPHCVAADHAGNLYVGEWLIGGRYTRLTTRR